MPAVCYSGVLLPEFILNIFPLVPSNVYRIWWNRKEGHRSVAFVDYHRRSHCNNRHVFTHVSQAPKGILIEKKFCKKSVDKMNHFLVGRSTLQFIGGISKTGWTGRARYLISTTSSMYYCPLDLIAIPLFALKDRKIHGLKSYVHLSSWLWRMLPAWGELQVLRE